MNKPLKALLNLVEKLTKGNPILRILIFAILIFCVFLVCASIVMYL